MPKGFLLSMRPFVYTLVIATFLSLGTPLASETLAPASEQTNPLPVFQKKEELGIAFQLLIPNLLHQDLDVTLPMFGPYGSIPIGLNQIDLFSFYGSSDFVANLLLLEADFRINVFNPFINGYILLGMHFLHFRVQQNNHRFFGPVAGLGFYFPMARSFNMGLYSKIYVSRKNQLAFGGGFSFEL